MADDVGVRLSERALADKARYHPVDPDDYGSPVGMPVENDEGGVDFYCVGCWYCCPEDGDRV